MLPKFVVNFFSAAATGRVLRDSYKFLLRLRSKLKPSAVARRNEITGQL